jgi:hypothetical protein
MTGFPIPESRRKFHSSERIVFVFVTGRGFGFRFMGGLLGGSWGLQNKLWASFSMVHASLAKA